MANREKLTTLTRKQVTDIQNSNKTHMDLRHRTLGLRQQIQHINNTDTSQNSSESQQMRPGT